MTLPYLVNIGTCLACSWQHKLADVKLIHCDEAVRGKITWGRGSRNSAILASQELVDVFRCVLLRTFHWLPSPALQNPRRVSRSTCHSGQCPGGWIFYPEDLPLLCGKFHTAKRENKGWTVTKAPCVNVSMKGAEKWTASEPFYKVWRCQSSDLWD